MVLLCVRLDHDVAVDEDGADDDDGEEGVGEHVDGDPPDGMEWRQEVHGLLRRKPVYRASLRDDDERLLVLEVGVDVADRGARKLQGKLAIAARKVVSWKKRRKESENNERPSKVKVNSYPARVWGLTPTPPHQTQNLAHKACEHGQSHQTPEKDKKRELVSTLTFTVYKLRKKIKKKSDLYFNPNKTFCIVVKTFEKFKKNALCTLTQPD